MFIKNNPEIAKKLIGFSVGRLYEISVKSEPVMPETAEKIQNLIKENKSPEQPLFVCKD